MADTYNGDPTNDPTGYTLPEDGDTIDAASVRPAFEGLIDKTEHINWPATLNTKSYPLASRSLRRTQSGLWRFDPADCGYDMSYGATINDGLIMNTLGCVAFFVLDLPDGGTLTAIDVTTQGAAGHVALPLTTDRFALELFVGNGDQADPGAIPASQIATKQYDPTVGTGNYEFEHTFTFTLGTPYVVDRKHYRLIVVATNEKGANAVTGLRVVELATKVTVTSQDPGAS